jgi:hypothetical protein
MNDRKPGTRRTMPAPQLRPHTADRRPSTCYQPCEQLLAGWIAGASRRRRATPHRHRQPAQRATTMNHARTRIRNTRRRASAPPQQQRTVPAPAPAPDNGGGGPSKGDERRRTGPPTTRMTEHLPPALRVTARKVDRGCCPPTTMGR